MIFLILDHDGRKNKRSSENATKHKHYKKSVH
jgi:hypothetical protein